MSKPKIGRARYSGETKRQYFKLKEGSSVFRILPPLGDLADEGRWSMFYSVHYGYKDSKGKMRVFQSPLVKDRKSGLATSPDAALERIETLRSEMEKAKKAGDAVKVEKIKELLKTYNLDKNHYMNVVDLQGNIGVLKLRHKAKLVLDAVIKQLRSEGVDPLSSDDGRFFVFTRTGVGTDTTFQVSVYKEKLKVEGVGMVERDVVHALTDDILNRLGTEAAQLDKLFKKLTSEEVARVVKEGPRALDEIYSESATDSEAQEDGEDQDDSAEESVSTTAAMPSTPVAPSVTAPVATVSVAAPSPTKAEPVTTSKTTAQAVSGMSDEDFLKSLGL